MGVQQVTKQFWDGECTINGAQYIGPASVKVVHSAQMLLSCG